MAYIAALEHHLREMKHIAKIVVIDLIKSRDFHQAVIGRIVAGDDRFAAELFNRAVILSLEVCKTDVRIAARAIFAQLEKCQHGRRELDRRGWPVFLFAGWGHRELKRRAHIRIILHGQLAIARFKRRNQRIGVFGCLIADQGEIFFQKLTVCVPRCLFVPFPRRIRDEPVCLCMQSFDFFRICFCRLQRRLARGLCALIALCVR